MNKVDSQLSHCEITSSCILTSFILPNKYTTRSPSQRVAIYFIKTFYHQYTYNNFIVYSFIIFISLLSAIKLYWSMIMAEIIENAFSLVEVLWHEHWSYATMILTSGKSLLWCFNVIVVASCKIAPLQATELSNFRRWENFHGQVPPISSQNSADRTTVKRLGGQKKYLNSVIGAPPQWAFFLFYMLASMWMYLISVFSDSWRRRIKKNNFSCCKYTCCSRFVQLFIIYISKLIELFGNVVSLSHFRLYSSF